MQIPNEQDLVKVRRLLHSGWRYLNGLISKECCGDRSCASCRLIGALRDIQSAHKLPDAVTFDDYCPDCDESGIVVDGVCGKCWAQANYE